MAEVIRMPRLSDTMEEGVIVGWLKKEGDAIEPGDLLAEVETDKATMELESYQEGTLLHIAVKEGPVPVDSVIAVLGDEGEDYQAVLDEAKAEQEDQKEDKEEEAESDQDAPSDDKESSSEKTGSTKTSEPSDSGDDDRIKASPLAKKMAKDEGIDLRSVSGSGDGGRIVKKDIEKAIESGVQQPAAASSIQISAGEDRVIPVSQMRKVIGKRLGESKFTSPHFYITAEIDMDAAIAARKSLNSDDEQQKISFNDLVIKAVAMALRKHPFVNSSWEGDKIVQHGDINIGVAVAVDEGLLVPVIHNADFKSLSQIKSEIVELAGKARNKKLQPDEMQGNTFTISNLGMFGVDEFTAIINPPDACILAVGTINTKPVVKDGEIVIGNTMKVTLSCDHRVVDGAVGAQFIQTLRSYLEHPMKMLR
ncbi:pyruvate dehydrogenase complex dihydrolipoamide acetyltransferase [Membranicola marinus]|uniref:Acetyltransferase component of pyruvate dehydrogenase complex n=1 Tax=Membranihabitans marinus TaxID=1227546 RepID=A0A953LAS5_9BACT|nr:pyruvate dehydrogenase complex dihydrolipoamide acetyltransferase [Membranihabitans marinus]MBY5957881.1 pyruvate dehydrogenase complex dihydrolipoamide acetyltransferase [Membranihabitans marinus]